MLMLRGVVRRLESLMVRVFQVLAVITVSGVVFATTDRVLNATRMERLPKNFSVVRAGVLCRSGQLRPEHLCQVVREAGVRTVVCLNPTDRPDERELCQRLGVNYHSFTMPGSGLGSADGFHAFLRIVGDPANRPVMVHCAAGAYRTGVAGAAYRVHFEGWTIEDAFREMRYSGCLIDGDIPLQTHVRKVIDSIPAEMNKTPGK
jgi:protein tyrosine/serine phosphatase